MKNLDLNAFGVEEINELQMSEVDGGQAGRNNLPYATWDMYVASATTAFLYDVFVHSFNR